MLGGNCSPCCGAPSGCNFTQPEPGSSLTLSAHSSVYGNSVFSIPSGNPAEDLQGIGSKSLAYSGGRTLSAPESMMSVIWARSYFNRSNYSVHPWDDQSLQWARLNNIGVTTFCFRQYSGDTLGQFLRIQFQALFFNTQLNLSVTAHGVDDQQVSETLTNASASQVNFFNVSLPAGFAIESVVIFYQFLEITDPRTDARPQAFLDSKSIPLQETITFRGLYDSAGSQLMYNFAQNFELP